MLNDNLMVMLRNKLKVKIMNIPQRHIIIPKKNQEDNGSNVSSASASTPDPASVSASNKPTGFIKVSETFNNNGLVNFSTSSISVVDSSIVSI